MREHIIKIHRRVSRGGRLTGTVIPFTMRFMFTLEYTEGVVADLKDIRAAVRKRILDKIDEQLIHNPSQETRNKKMIAGLKIPWEHEEPVWELRVGKYRVFYDVDETGQRVVIRAIRQKPPHQTTEEIL